MRIPILLLLVLLIAVAPDAVVSGCQAAVRAAVTVVGELLADPAAVTP